MTPKQITLFTDGACIGNPGPGGWACILQYGEHARELFGCAPATTNNRMELQAVLAGLSALKEPCDVLITTDSKYVQKGLTEWLDTWKKNDWKRGAGGALAQQSIKNRDLWEALDTLKQMHTIRLEWVKGHASHPENNRCDHLATMAARHQISSSEPHIPS